MTERSGHGEQRHRQKDRPTSEAFRDRENPLEIYFDRETEYDIFVGHNGRTHIFLPDGTHHTSFRTTKRGRQKRMQKGRWIRIK
jgi:hypothetical protein